MHGILIFALILITFLLQGCPKSISISLYNNSSSDFIVESKDGLLVWDAGTSLVFEGKNIDRLEWIQEEKYFVPALKIKHESLLVVYRFMSFNIPSSYIGNTEGGVFSVGALVYKFQMEEDLKLYVVKPEQEFPVDIQAQPHGFPVEPIRQVSIRPTAGSSGAGSE